MKFALLFLAFAASPAFAQGDTPYGRPADAATAKRTVRVEMSDQMRFSPSEVEVKRGEVVRFEAVNRGQVVHEMVLGTLDGLKKHGEAMKAHGAHAMPHQEPNAVQVEPGKTGVLGWRFTKAGTFYYGCLVPGHFEAGMVGKVTVK